MYIQCTKKLLAKLKQPYEELSNPPHPQYCWHANYFEYQGIVFIAIMNDYSEEEYFVEVMDFQEFPVQFMQEIRRDMEELGMSAEEISSYYKEAGPIVFGPTGNRDQVAKLNGFTRRLKHFTISTIAFLNEMTDIAQQEGVPLDFDELEQPSPYYKGNPKPRYTPAKYDIPVPRFIPMIQLDVALKLIGDTQVERSFFVPMRMNFASLHEILSIGFGWSGTQPHEFDFSEFGCRMIQKDRFDENSHVQEYDEETTSLSGFLPSKESFRYHYGFQQGWDHVITVGEISNVDDGPFVTCLGGKGSSPLESCTGAAHYAQMCDILNDPSHDDYDEMQELLGEFFDTGFDKESINEELGDLEFTPQVIKKHTN